MKGIDEMESKLRTVGRIMWAQLATHIREDFPAEFAKQVKDYMDTVKGGGRVRLALKITAVHLSEDRKKETLILDTFGAMDLDPKIWPEG